MSRKKIAAFDAPDQATGAKVYADAEWQEYRVIFYRAGAKMEGADYHTSDKLEAFDNATLHAFPEVADCLPALQAWRDVMRNEWKERLSIAWMRGHYPMMTLDQSASLQRLRNVCGPSWLRQYPARVGNT